jgi:hypothetical protein
MAAAKNSKKNYVANVEQKLLRSRKNSGIVKKNEKKLT